jgi:chemotaxis signal transduction protein
MTTSTIRLGRSVDHLRWDFDQSFAEPPRSTSPETLDLLAIRIGGDPYALQIGELASLGLSRKVVPVPSRRPDVLGLAGIRGSIVSVYSLAVLLGYGLRAAQTRWLALCGPLEPVALAFEDLEGFHRVNREDLCSPEPGRGSRHHVALAVRVGKLTRLVVSTRSILAALEVGAGASSSTKEQ